MKRMKCPNQVKLVLMTACFSCLSFFGTLARAADGTANGGGGHDAGVEFEAAFEVAMANCQKNFPDLYTRLQAAGVTADKGVMVIAVDKYLPITINGITQNSAATNDPDHGVILVNTPLWNEITDEHAREGLALHEFASLKHLESTGQYPYSSIYLAKFGLNVNVWQSNADEKSIENEVPRVMKALNAEGAQAWPSETYNQAPDECIQDSPLVLGIRVVQGYHKLHYGELVFPSINQFFDWATPCECYVNVRLWYGMPATKRWIDDGSWLSPKCTARSVLADKAYMSHNPRP